MPETSRREVNHSEELRATKVRTSGLGRATVNVDGFCAFLEPNMFEEVGGGRRCGEAGSCRWFAGRLDVSRSG